MANTPKMGEMTVKKEASVTRTKSEAPKVNSSSAKFANAPTGKSTTFKADEKKVKAQDLATAKKPKGK